MTSAFASNPIRLGIVAATSCLAVVIPDIGCVRADEAAVSIVPTFPFHQGEAESLEAALMADVEANRSRRCVRPPLHGEPLDGEADADILSVVEDSDENNRCLDLFADEPSLFEWEMNPRGEPPPIVTLATWLCEPMAEKVSRAVRHADACSPFLVGRGVPASGATTQLMRSAKAAILVAQDRARRGDARAAIALLTDEVRLAQDAARGRGATVVDRIAAETTAGIAIDWGIRPLLDYDTVTLTDIDFLISDLSQLLDTGTTVADVLDGEREVMGLRYLLPSLREPGWVPPGGEEPDRGAAIVIMLSKGWPDPNDVLRQWVVDDAVHRHLRDVCLPEMRPTECFAAMEKRARQAGAIHPLSEAESARLSWGGLACYEVRGGDREEAIDHLLSCFALDRFEYMKQGALIPYFVAAARFHARVRGERLRTGRCPTTTELRSESWAPWNINPLSGERFDVVEEASGLWLVDMARRDEWMRWWDPQYRVSCLW